jgi:hypothetical protein
VNFFWCRPFLVPAGLKPHQEPHPVCFDKYIVFCLGCFLVGSGWVVLACGGVYRLVNSVLACGGGFGGGFGVAGSVFGLEHMFVWQKNWALTRGDAISAIRAIQKWVVYGKIKFGLTRGNTYKSIVLPYKPYIITGTSRAHAPAWARARACRARAHVCIYFFYLYGLHGRMGVFPCGSANFAAIQTIFLYGRSGRTSKTPSQSPIFLPYRCWQGVLL